jgi:hypothetical protein
VTSVYEVPVNQPLPGSGLVIGHLAGERWRVSDWGLGLEPFGERCAHWSQELGRLSGVAAFALLLKCPHEPEGAAELPAENGPIREGHGPQGHGDYSGARRELVTVGPQGVGDGDRFRAVHVEAFAGCVGNREASGDQSGEVGCRDHVQGMRLAAEDEGAPTAEVTGQSIHEVGGPEDRVRHTTGRDGLFRVELGPQISRGRVRCS